MASMQRIQQSLIEGGEELLIYGQVRHVDGGVQVVDSVLAASLEEAVRQLKPKEEPDCSITGPFELEEELHLPF